MCYTSIKQLISVKKGGDFFMKLKKMREEKNISQKEIAEMLGITQQAYSRIELGQAKPSLLKAKDIADFFNVSIEEIFFENKHNR